MHPDNTLRSYNRALTPRAQELRRNATPQENRLWYDFLSSHPLRFLRQRVFGSYIVDFYCDEARLVIEIDGGQHFTSEGIAYDQSRTAFLESLQLRVIRFANREIDQHFESVCQAIDNVVMHQLYPEPNDMDI